MSLYYANCFKKKFILSSIHYNNMKNDKELHIMKVLPEMFAAAIIDGTWYRVEILVVSLLKETVMASSSNFGEFKFSHNSTSYIYVPISFYYV